MKKTNYIVSGVFAIAVTILFFTQCTEKKTANQSNPVSAGDSSGSTRLPVAYVDVDSLLDKYNFHNDLKETMLSKVESLRLNMTQKQKDLEKEILEFQQKIDNNVFFDKARAQQEEQRLMRKRQELNNYAVQKQAELDEDQMRISLQLNDTITSGLKVFNATKKYQIIFSTRGNSSILLADDEYNITNEVAEFFNKRYVPSNTK